MVEVYKYTKLGMKMGVEIDLLKSSSLSSLPPPLKWEGEINFPF